jgi:cyclohexanone monooxygenase
VKAILLFDRGSDCDCASTFQDEPYYKLAAKFHSGSFRSHYKQASCLQRIRVNRKSLTIKHYIGVSCDVDSLLYLPFLEETGYVPKDRFSYGPEIREHVERIVQHWELRKRTHLQTDVCSVVWDSEISRWRVQTSHSDDFTAHFVVLAVGTLHKPKLPAISGIEDFEGHHFHTGRFNYEVTGGNDVRSELKGLEDKNVAIIGTGASAVQLVPHLARYSRRLCVFQRTPSTVTPRENWKNDVEPILKRRPGWQEAEMELFANIMQGELTDEPCTALEGLEALTARAVTKNAEEAGVEVTPKILPDLLKAADLRLMESLRRYVEESVRDPETAEKLKPW